MSGRIFVATRKGLFTLNQSLADQGSWHVGGTDFLADNVTLVLQDPRDRALYVALDHGHFGVKMHRSRDDGHSWQPIAAPTYPPKPEGLEDRDGFGKPVPWNTVLIWGLAAGGADEPGVLWAGTIPGGVFKSGDHGESWQLQHALWDHPGRKKWTGGGMDLAGAHHICVDPRDSRIVRVGVSCGGIWETRDGGSSWACRADGLRADYMPPEREFDPGIQDAHALAQCKTHPDRMWVQHHNGIFVSSDASASWAEIKQSEVGVPTFGFAVAAHPRDPDTAWFVPAIKDEKRIPRDGRLVVTRTRDGGKTFATLSVGLPQQHAYDIVLRHALDVDSAGETLAMGSTTGGVWIGDHGGDQWRAIEARLPPVYCVRFDGAG